MLPQILATLPAAMNVNVMSDRTVTIRASVADVEFELALAVVLVVLVIFVFLRSLRATLIADRALSWIGGTTIEDEAFIGPGAIVLPTVTIGRGAVVTAGSVVSSSVPPINVDHSSAPLASPGSATVPKPSA